MGRAEEGRRRLNMEGGARQCMEMMGDGGRGDGGTGGFVVACLIEARSSACALGGVEGVEDMCHQAIVTTINDPQKCKIKKRAGQFYVCG